MRQFTRPTACAMFIMMMPAPAFACAACMMGYVDLFLPPAGAWILFSVAWFLSLCAYSGFTGVKLTLIPKLVAGIIWVVVLAVLSLMYLGPLFIVILLLASFAGTLHLAVRLVRPENRPSVSHRWFLLALVAGVTAMVAYSAWTGINRSDAEFYLDWGRTHIGKAVLARIAARGPDGAADLRRIVGAGESWAVSAAAPHLAAVAVPETDIPLLLDAYQRCYFRDSDYVTELEAIESVLRQLTGYDLPEGSKPSAWKRKWQTEK